MNGDVHNGVPVVDLQENDKAFRRQLKVKGDAWLSQYGQLQVKTVKGEEYLS